jgi:hypothetical protein
MLDANEQSKLIQHETVFGIIKLQKLDVVSYMKLDNR